MFSPDGSRFLLADESRIVIYDRDGNVVVETPLVKEGLAIHVFGTAWAEDNARVATAENPMLRLRDAADLSVVAERDIGRGPIAFCAGGSLLAIGDRRLYILDVPTLAERGALTLEWGDYDSFDIDHVVADPVGTLVAATDYGGYTDDEWGHAIDRGLPKLTLLDAATPTKSTHDLTQTQPITELELDRWRQRFLVGNYQRIVVRQLDSTPVTEWVPYGRITVAALAVCERFVATLPDIRYSTSLTVDFWDPVTYAKLGRAPLLETTERMALLSLPTFVSASPDGSRLLLPEPDGVRVWAVDEIPVVPD